ncbi:MAG TPA: SDR family NAD(P)-dependent oxidoreductase [Pirellulales bacterium]|nr:SDR family NAD(P)-dependent oxidoreductase [Pirellulales bacterium]
MSLDLSQRVAVVTGGASGIGRATALLLARHGAKVWIGDLHPNQENAALFEPLGITQLACDVRREADVVRLVEAATRSGSRLDILVHSAGVGLVKQIPAVSEAEWDACLDTNLKGAFLAAKHAIGPMRQSGGGAIVNISSNAGLLPRAHDPVYSTSKAALIALTKCLALCHAADKIRVNAVCPGPVGDTGMMNADLAAAADPEATKRRFIAASPLARAHGRMIDPAEVAQSVLYLVSDAAAMVTGTAVAIDGGKSLGVPPMA